MDVFRLLALLTLLSLALSGCSSGADDRKEQSVAVIAENLQREADRTETQAIGTARAAQSAELYPESNGRVLKVLFQAGDYVRKGQTLLQIDSRQERLAVEAARVQVREANQLLGRYRRIEDTGAISESQIEAGETALASAQVALKQAEASLADRTVRAPFSGHIGLTEIDPGDRVTTSTPIARLDQRSTLYVDFSAPEEVFGQLRVGQNVRAVPFSDTKRGVEARILATDSRASENGRDFIVRAVIPNSDDSLRPGMSFRVTFQGPGTIRPMVPEEAILWGSDGSYLFVLNDGTARRVPVTIVSRRDGYAFVSGKLSESDRVIVKGVQKLRDGQKIRLVQASERAPQKVRIQPAGSANEG
ncbi:efflux RND transporter periplasmic adaptor subunit [Altericroceibacterium endophyticum]|uniref:Efflux RND transporter periplasmic adaptor subunit n=1 Tax=Altericroceibacterium endophyticum TaxID=1808508 RepID=A0A6I4TA90_9SPHN|nr:efflux RND transporter periplasmic adaptor subunit [Altericroceibacterium endophyticum]MXO66933.1 efflux RND transporter periplasmic adaptor subunit [Altericroceibacterium endophyticum]